MLGVLTLTAGLGTRMRTLTRLRPKSLMPVLGTPVLEWVLAMVQGLEVQIFAANVHHLRDVMLEGIWEWNRKSPKQVLGALEEAVLLGSGGGLVHAAHRFPNVTEWLVLNGDSFLDERLEAFLSDIRNEPAFKVADCVLLGLRDALGSYTALNMDGTKLQGFAKPQVGGVFFSGISWWRASVLKQFTSGQPSDFVKDLLEPLMRAGRASVQLRAHQWFDVGTPPTYYGTHMALLKRWQSGMIPPHWKLIAPGAFQRQGVWVSSRGSLNAGIQTEGLNFVDIPFNGLSLGPGAILYADPPVLQTRPARGIWLEEGVWCE